MAALLFSSRICFVTAYGHTANLLSSLISNFLWLKRLLIKCSLDLETGVMPIIFVKSLQEALFHCKGVAQIFLLRRDIVRFFVGEHIDVFFDT